MNANRVLFIRQSFNLTLVLNVFKCKSGHRLEPRRYINKPYF